jgi:hypothetical protein
MKEQSIFYYIYFVASTLYSKIYNTFICRTENIRTEAVYQDIDDNHIDTDDCKNNYYNEVNLEPLVDENTSFYDGLTILFKDFYEFLYSIEKRRDMLENGKTRVNITKKFFTYIT